ncbi:LysR family transcriptional regulator [Pelagibius sp. Alg239-R121]|uniref:LysR family transcriptional regulator n=1 Tax=Pelagibius sp. Alg239-R121 TaxID=2993448 RepID=UPI0024A6A820|nr:LysR family transcriptional regulator [Pelagibius sp. Alg239-R121]
MNQQLLSTFLDVLETRNFNRSAERLDVTQSTVSARIRQLEDELGVRLFERGRGGAEATKAGRRFEVHCRSLMALWGHTKRDVRARQTARPNSLHITGQYNLIRTYLLDWVDQLRTHNSDWAMQLEVNFSEQIQRDVLDGETDIGIVFTPQQTPDLQITEIGVEHYWMLSTKAATMEEVDLESYIKISYTPHFERCHQDQLSHLANPSLIAGCDDVAVEFLKRLGGTLYLPKHVAQEVLETIPGLKLVRGAPVITQSIYSLVHIRRRNDPQIVRALSILPAISASQD